MVDDKIHIIFCAKLAKFSNQSKRNGGTSNKSSPSEGKRLKASAC